MPVPRVSHADRRRGLLAQDVGSTVALLAIAVLAALLADTLWYLAGRRYGLGACCGRCARSRFRPIPAWRRPSRSSPDGAQLRCFSPSSSRASRRWRRRWPARSACATGNSCCSTRSGRCSGLASRSRSVIFRDAIGDDPGNARGARPFGLGLVAIALVAWVAVEMAAAAALRQATTDGPHLRGRAYAMLQREPPTTILDVRSALSSRPAVASPAHWRSK